MAEITLKPIVIPRAWDGKRIHFAVFFNFEMLPGGQAPQSPDVGFDNWPSVLGKLAWHKADQPEPANANTRVHLEIRTGAVQPKLAAVSWSGFKAKEAEEAWKAIIGKTWEKRSGPTANSAAKRGGELANIFRTTKAQTQAGADTVAYGSDVVVNPTGGSDLRPTQRIESLEMTSASEFALSTEMHSLLASADRHELAKAKTVAFANRAALATFAKTASAARAPGQTLASAISIQLATAPAFSNTNHTLVTALHLANQAGVDGGRLRRSVDLGKNRPAKGIDPEQLANPNVTEVLARLKQHPIAMRKLGLVIDCSASPDLHGATSVSGLISLKLGSVGNSIELVSVATEFELATTPVPFFRAQQQSGGLDNSEKVWRQFHLLPPEYFELRQDDSARMLMRTQQGARAQADTGHDSGLTDAIIIQAKHPTDASVATTIHKRLKQAQSKLDAGPDANGYKFTYHAEDLMSGVTFEVALEGKDGKVGPWHSLCRRSLSVVAIGAKDALLQGVEDGYVSMSVATSAAPLVGTITGVVQSADDDTSLDKYVVQLDQVGAYNTPQSEAHSPGGLLVTSRRKKPLSPEARKRLEAEPAVQPTQLRCIFRDYTDIKEIALNGPANPNRDRMLVTLGPQVKGQAATLVESLFLSPIFTTTALDDPELPQTSLQVFRATSPLRSSEQFHLAFDGTATAFLKADGTVFPLRQPNGSNSWLPDFKSFEAEGERRAYVRTASDAAAQQQLGALTGSDLIAAVVSDSLPQATLTVDQAMQFGKVTMLPLPFVPPAKTDRFTKLPSGNAVYPLSFRFRGRVASVTPTPGVKATLDIGLTGIAGLVLRCPESAISDRAGHPIGLQVADVVSGDGILATAGGVLTVVQLHRLGGAQSIFPEAKAARDDPFMAQLPRAVRIEAELQAVRGPVTGRIGFDCAGVITKADKGRFAFARYDKEETYRAEDVQKDCTFIEWPQEFKISSDQLETVSGETRFKKTTVSEVRKFILPPGMAVAEKPNTGQIIAAKGRIVGAVLDGLDTIAGKKADDPGIRRTTVFLVESWNVLSRQRPGGTTPPDDKDLSDEARAAKSTPHLDWIVTVSTDDRGDVPINFDGTFAPSFAASATLFHPLGLQLPTDKGDTAPLWVDAVCTKALGKLRGSGWPGWIAAYSPGFDKDGLSRKLTMVDLRSLTIKAIDGDDRKARTGYFRLTGTRGNVALVGTDPFDHFKGVFVSKPPLMRLLGEVVTTEIDESNCVLHIAGLTGKAPWQLQVRCAPEARFADITPDLLSRRAVDLLPGDCVFATVRPDPAGWFELIATSEDRDAAPAPTEAPNAVALAAGLAGKWSPGTPSGRSLTRAVLASGSVDFLAGSVNTPLGVSRQVFAPKGVAGAPPFQPGQKFLEGAMLRYLPLAYARTIIAHKAPAPIPAPPKKGAPGVAAAVAAAQTSLPAVHAIASDALARWRGWWITVPQPGNSDLKQKDRVDGWGIRLTCKPHGSMLPLRVGKTYWIRGWRTDLAGNIGYDTLEKEVKENFNKKELEKIAKPLKNFRRPDLPLAPILAQPGKDLGKPSFSYLGYGLVVDPDREESAPEPPPGSSSQSLLLVLATNRKGNTVAARQSPESKDSKGNKVPTKTIYYASAHLLPPPVDVETALSSGKLDGKSGDQVAQTIYDHEQFYDDPAFGQRKSLNYFPDPFATEAVLGISEMLPSALHQPGNLNEPGHVPALISNERLSFFPKGDWPANSAAPKIELAGGALGIAKTEQGGATLRVPAARVAQVHIVAGGAGDKNGDVIKNPGLTVDLIHAVTGPLRQPQWISLVGDPVRKAGDTAQSWKGQLGLHRPSTGSVSFALNWNDLWDETVPALFGAAKVRARASKGAINSIVIESPGFGYGSEAVVKAIEAASGKGALLLPIVDSGRLVAVSIENGGSGYPSDADIVVRIARRPPLHTLAAAVAKVAGGKIEKVLLTGDSQVNGYYARPPVVRIHDLKGTGYGAACNAVVSDGVVTEFSVTDGGQDYSDSLVVGLYTGEAGIAEQPVPDRTSLQEPIWGTFPFEMSHGFGDTRARHVRIVGEARTRFRDEVSRRDEEPMHTERRRFELPSAARPPKPEIAYLMPSFSPIRRLEGSPAGQLIEQREAMIRCYIQRPWNVTGDELLGVVVYAAQTNTSILKEDPAREGLIPEALRKYVSRWGFDPIWDDVATAPLTLDDFTNAVDVARYDDLAEFASSDKPPVGVALHQMHYNADRDMWYADIAVRPPAVGMPFVQFAFVRYQPNSVQGLTMSEVALADPIVLPGRRRLKVQRASRDEIALDVIGNFDGPRTHDKKATALPLRKMVVELRRRPAGAAREIEGELASLDGRDGGIDELDRWELKRAEDRRSFSGRIALGSAFDRNPRELYLAVKELEVYPTGASHRDRTGSSGAITNNKPTFEKLVFYRAIGLLDLPGS